MHVIVKGQMKTNGKVQTPAEQLYSLAASAFSFRAALPNYKRAARLMEPARPAPAAEIPTRWQTENGINP